VTGNARHTPSFVMLPRELLASDAWRSLSINARRFVDFLMLEHLAHGGKENGNLKATARQLYTFGIGAHQLTAAIFEVEQAGLVDCHRGGMRVATIYSLTWLPLHDGSPPSDRWREYRKPRRRRLRGQSKNLHVKQQADGSNLPVKQQAGLHVKQQADGSNLPVKQQADARRNLPVKQQVLSRNRSYQGGAVDSEVGDKGEGVETGQGIVTRLPDYPPSGKPNRQVAL
jgi:hypothetical protein